MRFHRFGSFLLLVFGAANVLADPGHPRRDPREAVRTYHIQSVTMDRNLPREPVQNIPPERRREGTGMPESSGYGSSGDGQSHSQQAENMRRQGQGRMTPEERRALRRQIDEAGHDIYSPKR
jgi:hypothetical protein